MTARKTDYPDVSDILARKQRGREKLAAIPFAAKLQLLEAMRERDQVFRAARAARGKKAERRGER